MATNKIQIEDHNGDIYYPHTSADVVKRGTSTVDADLKSVENKFNEQGAALGAAKLATARKINGVSFDGTKDIIVEDDTKVKKTGDTMTGELTMQNADINLGRAKIVNANEDNTLRISGTANNNFGAIKLGSGARIYGHDGDQKLFVEGGIYTNEDIYTTAGIKVEGNAILNTINTHYIKGADGNRWNVMPVVNDQGVMEVGRYIDFHNSKANMSDYTFRLDNNGSMLYHSGTLAQGSDRNLKENIVYLEDEVQKSKIKKETFVDFIKNIKFATYNYKGAEEVNFGFIAQDIADSEVGQYMLREHTVVDFDPFTDEKNGEMDCLAFDLSGYTSIVAKALQEEIKFRDTQIKELEERVQKLEAKIN